MGPRALAFPALLPIRAGTSGVGLEYAFWGGWSAKAEYDYVRLSSSTYTVATLPGNAFSGDVINSNNRVINLVLVGINYKFGPWW